MESAMTLAEAIHFAKEGAAIRSTLWGPNDPAFLLFVKGRLVQPFDSVKQHLGDTPFQVADHLDAYYLTIGEGHVSAACIVGYQFSQREILEPVWQNF